MSIKSIQLRTIAVVESPYKQKFAIPRQSGLVPSGRGLIRFLPEFAKIEAVEGISACSHIWVQFVFHGIKSSEWSPRVRPPRFGGNKRVGVFATRSTHRPNPLGLSVVKLERIDTSDGVALEVSGIDLLDGTPVVDIKPYVPYTDRVYDATNEIADNAPETIKVIFSDQSLTQIEHINCQCPEDAKTFITEVLQQDPRPAYQRGENDRTYGANLLNFNLRWRYLESGGETIIEVLGLDTPK